MTDNGEGLRIDIDVDLGQSEQGLDSLIATLGRLQSALETATSSVQRINSSQLSSEMEKLAGAMKPLATFEKRASAALEGLAKFTESASNMSVNSSFSKGMEKLVDALKPLGDIAKGDFVSVMNQLKKFPDIAKDLANTNLDEFAAEVKRLAEALRPLAEELGKVAAGFAALPKGITGASKAVSGFSSASKFGRGIKLGALFYTAKRVANVMTDWVETSNHYIENLNLFTVAMREGADEALEYAEKVQSAFAIDPSEWIRFQSVFQNMLTGFGIGSEKASGMSKSLTQLGYDLSTLFNVDYETAMKKLQSGIAGQPRPMREWGFDLSETTLKMTALNFGIKENVETMTQYEKSQLRFMQIMDTAKKQGILGNFAREIHTPANAMRILQQQIVQLKRALGNLLIPILMKVLPYLQAFVIVITDAIRALGVLVGFELPEIDYSGVEYGGIGDIGDDLEDIEDGAGGANSALQKLRSTILGIDELNLMADPTSGGAGGGAGGVIGGGVGSGLDFDLSDFDYDFLGDAKLKAIELVETFYDKIRPVVDFIRDNFDWISVIVLSIGTAMLAWKIATGVQAFVNTLAGMTDAGQITLGIALMLGGIALGQSGFTEIFSGQGTLASWLKAGIGAALGIGGALIAFGTGPLGWTIGITAVLSTLIIGAIKGDKINFANSELGIYTQAIKDNHEAIEKNNRETRDFLDNHDELKRELDAKWAGIKNLADRYFDLAEAAHLTNDEKVLLKQYAGELIGVIPELRDLIDEETGAYKGTREEIEKVMKKTEQYYRLQAARDFLIDIYKRQAEAEIDLNKLSDERLGLEAKREEQDKKIIDLWKEKGELQDSEITKHRELYGQIQEAERGYDALSDALEENGRLSDEVTQLLSELGIELGYVEQYMKDVGTAADEEFGRVVGAVDNMLRDINGRIINHKVPKLNIGFDVSGAPNIRVGGKIITMFADGGFPETGQMFIAREAGPELVGTIGGKSAVANDRQIEAGIARGVADAQTEQNALLREQNALLRQLASKDSSVRAVVTTGDIVSGLERQNRREGRTVVPLGV